MSQLPGVLSASLCRARRLALALGVLIAVAARQSAALEPVPYPVNVTAPGEQQQSQSPPAGSELEGSPPSQPAPAQDKLVVQPQTPIKKPRVISEVPLVSTDAPPPLIWKWRTFGLADYIITAAGAGLTLTASIVKPSSNHKLSGGILFDESVRDTLRADTLADRYIFRDASDVGLSLAVTWPFVTDALITAWWYRGSREVAQEMSLINLQAMAISGALQGVTNVLVSRERPFGRDCGGDELPEDAIDCANSVHYRSFFSGHSAFSFTGAALICVHHFENDLMGPPWDALSCAGGYAVAATTASFRVVSDVHYSSDILLGAAVGTLVGWGVPLLHYRVGAAPKTASQAPALQLTLVPSPNGIGVAGIF
jgi:membrane-associated phospholipid phosphatase